VKPLTTWFNTVLSPGGPQSKKLAYLFIIFNGMGCLIVDLLFERTLTPTWVAAFGLLVGAVTGSYLGGKAIEKEKT
jgi:hypothetical protein